MVVQNLVKTGSGKSGKWLAGTIAIGGIALALIAMKFRVFTPLPTDVPTTQTTRPADVEL